MIPHRAGRAAAAALAAALVAAAGLAALPAPTRAAAPRERPAAAPARPLIEAVGPVEMTVADLERSVDFYTRVLDFEPEGDVVEVAGPEVERLTGVFGARLRQATLRLGGEHLQLTEYVAPRGRGRPETLRSNDRFFQHVAIIVSDMDRAYRRLREHRVEHASSGPQRLPDWNPNAGGIEAFYFRDPDGHHLEVLAFPPGKGDPRWHRATDRLFLGIDHTAIVVGDTETSLAFYRDLLGLRVAGTAENWGTEQEHLNSVHGARLRITGLRAASGPAIEFLEYLSPSDGRPYPPDAAANDLIHWQTALRATDLDAAWAALRARGASFVSPGPVALPDRALGFGRGLLVRDPDGHVLEVIER